MERYRHKWATDKNGDKQCSRCNSIIRKSGTNSGFIKYVEGGYGGVDFYPRCKLKDSPNKEANCGKSG